jgi:hypothetical protein
VLGCWLTAVAHRIAVRTRGQRAKRFAREMQADAPEPAVREGDGLLWREACGLLHQELDQLPDEFRLPLVLCYLEGLTRDEAAQTLGCSLDAVKGRLERGRARLRGRLERRGVSLSAGLLDMLAAPSVVMSFAAGGGGLPERLVQTTLQVASVGRLPARLGILVNGATYAMKTKIKLLTAAVLAVGVLSGFGLWLMASPPPAQQQSNVVRPPAAEPGDDNKPAEPKKEDKDTIDVTGSVLGTDGKPCAGAKLFAPKLKRPMPIEPEDIGVEEIGKTGADGTFKVTVKSLVVGRTYVIAYAEGAGIDFIELSGKAPADKVTLKLVKDQPITGKVLDTEGKPLAGVTVGVSAISIPQDDNLDDYLAGWKKSWREIASTPEKRLYVPLDGITSVATTDKDGGFKLTGAGVERIAHVTIRGRVAKATPIVITRAGFDPKPYNDAASAQSRPERRIPNEQPVLCGPDFTYVAVPGGVVEGIVKEAAGGKPVAGARLNTISGFGEGATATTDKDGKYRLEGLPPGKTYPNFRSSNLFDTIFSSFIVLSP